MESLTFHPVLTIQITLLPEQKKEKNDSIIHTNKNLFYTNDISGIFTQSLTSSCLSHLLIRSRYMLIQSEESLCDDKSARAHI